MAPLDSFNNSPEIPVQKPTGISDSKNYQSPSNDLKTIQLREKVDEFISEVGLPKEETEAIIDTIISKFGNDEKIIDILLQNISSDISIDTKDKVMDIINKQEVKSDVQEVKSDVQEVKSDVQEVKSDVQEVNKEKEPLFEKLKGSLQGLKGEKSKIILDLLNNESDKDRFDKVISTLKSNQVTFDSVASELQQKGEKEYQEYKQTLISINPSFREQFDDFERQTVPDKAKMLLGTTDVNGVDLNKNTLRQEKDGAIIEASRNTRNISLVGSNYKLDSKLQNGSQRNGVQKIETNLTSDLKPINEVLNSVSSILEYLEKAISNNIELKDIKEHIKNSNIHLYNELNIENINNVSDIKTIFIGLQNSKEKEKQDKIKIAKGKIDDFILQNANSAKEQDERKKETLRFLSSIGFDAIPQSITDSVISQLNANSGLRVHLGLNGVIDLANGQLGFNSDNDITQISPKEKSDFARVFNKMIGGNDNKLIGGNDNKLIDVRAILNGTGNPVKDPLKLSVYLEENGYKNSGAAVGKMMENLSKSGAPGEKKEK